MSRLSLHRLGQRMRRDLDVVLSQGVGGQVTFYYQAKQIMGDGFDVNVESTYTTPPVQNKRLPALVHYFGAKTEELTGGEIVAGDAVITLRDDAQIDGVDLQEFDIDGTRYVQKKVGRELTKEWDVLVAGRRFARTIFVTRKH